MQEISNPFHNHYPGYNCFGCAPENPIGLHLRFFFDGETIVAKWKPTHDYEGYVNIVHGGLQATLLDEVGSWVIYAVLGTAGYTVDLQAQYLKHCTIDSGEIEIRAWLVSQDRKRVTIKGEIVLADKTVVTKAEMTYHIMSEEIAKAKFNYPGSEKFHEKAKGGS